MPQEIGNTDYFFRFASSVQYVNWLDHKKISSCLLSEADKNNTDCQRL